jgi:hypothetical protein
MAFRKSRRLRRNRRKSRKNYRGGEWGGVTQINNYADCDKYLRDFWGKKDMSAIRTCQQEMNNKSWQTKH